MEEILGWTRTLEMDPDRVPREESSYTALSRQDICAALVNHGFMIVGEFDLQANQVGTLDANSLNGRRVVIVPRIGIGKDDLENAVEEVFAAIKKRPVKEWTSAKYHSAVEYYQFRRSEKDLPDCLEIGMLTDEGDLIHKHIRKDGAVLEINRGRLTAALYIILFPDLTSANFSIGRSETCSEKHYGIGFNLRHQY